jgi:hypothetical protein
MVAHPVADVTGASGVGFPSGSFPHRTSGLSVVAASRPSTLPNVSLAREEGSDGIYLVLNDSRFYVSQQDFAALGFEPSSVLMVRRGSLKDFVERRLSAPPAVTASDVHFDLENYDALDGRWLLNCKSSRHTVKRDVLVAGWLFDPGMPYVNMCDFVGRGHTHGVEDIHYNVLIDPVFVARMYGPEGLSAQLRYAQCPGNLGSGEPSDAILPFAITEAAQERRVTFDSWFLPTSEFIIHGELNAWHKDDSGHFGSYHYKARGPAPDRWVNPELSNDSSYPGFVDHNCWFPFDVFNPIGDSAVRRLGAGDYVLMRGTLWEDGEHGEDRRYVPGRWDAWPPTRGHGGWLEIHPVDWIIRLEPPAVSARQSGRSLALCTEPGMTQAEPFDVGIRPDWPATRTTSSLQVRNVDSSIDPRFSAVDTIYVNTITDRVDHVQATGEIRGSTQRQGRFKGSWRVSWREIDRYDKPWLGFDDSLPPSAQSFTINESWAWRSDDPLPYSGKFHHVSTLANGIHQHWFHAALSTQSVGAEDNLFAHIYMSRQHPPRTIMLQWHAADGWEHRAFWGEDLIPQGTPQTPSRYWAGRLPFTDEWVRLEVAASRVGLAGKQVTGLAFTLFDGQAAWDYAGVRSPINPSSDAAYKTQSVPTEMIGGQKYTVSVSMLNVGASTWSNADGYRLGSVNPVNNRTWGLNRVPCPDTKPGAIGTFKFGVTAPPHSGSYGFQWQLLQEPEWFGAPSDVVSIRVLPPPGRTTVPDVIEMYRDVATKHIRRAGLEPKYSGTNDRNAYVAGQTPPADTDVDAGSVVTLYLKPGPIP